MGSCVRIEIVTLKVACDISGSIPPLYYVLKFAPLLLRQIITQWIWRTISRHKACYTLIDIMSSDSLLPLSSRSSLKPSAPKLMLSHRPCVLKIVGCSTGMTCHTFVSQDSQDSTHKNEISWLLNKAEWIGIVFLLLTSSLYKHQNCQEVDSIFHNLQKAKLYPEVNSLQPNSGHHGGKAGHEVPKKLWEHSCSNIQELTRAFCLQNIHMLIAGTNIRVLLAHLH